MGISAAGEQGKVNSNSPPDMTVHSVRGTLNAGQRLQSQDGSAVQTAFGEVFVR